MTDNSSLPVASGNETFANDDIGGVKYPRPKINWGPDGTANDVDVATGKPLPTQLRSPTGVDLTGSSGAASAAVLTVQGIAGGTAQPVSIATAPVLVAGSAIIGKVGIDQTTDGTTNKVRAILHDGTTAAVVKAASTAPVATDPAIVVAISPNSVNTNVQNGAPATIIAVVPAATANGATSSRVKAAASTNATNLKASAGQIYGLDFFNNAAYAVYFKLYNKASSPTVGTDTPVWTIPVAAGGGFSREFPRGKTFATGISYAITKLEADGDTTVVVADDLTGSIDWI